MLSFTILMETSRTTSERGRSNVWQPQVPMPFGTFISELVYLDTQSKKKTITYSTVRECSLFMKSLLYKRAHRPGHHWPAGFAYWLDAKSPRYRSPGQPSPITSALCHSSASILYLDLSLFVRNCRWNTADNSALFNFLDTPLECAELVLYGAAPAYVRSRCSPPQTCSPRHASPITCLVL